MLSAITVCLVPEARLGPFVFHTGLEDACRNAAQLGFDAIEIFPPDASVLDTELISGLLEKYSLRLAAVGTGAGWVRHQLTLVSPDAATCQRAVDFIVQIIEAAGRLGAPAIIGSMQGRAANSESREETLNLLGRSISQLANHAAQFDVPLLIEPLNRYETNLLNEVSTTAKWIAQLPTNNLRILADLFHMNIEEADIAHSIRAAGNAIGHVHFADSNRRAVGLGHSPLEPAIQALRDIHYQGYLSAEIFPLPDATEAAQTTINSFRRLCAS